MKVKVIHTETILQSLVVSEISYQVWNKSVYKYLGQANIKGIFSVSHIQISLPWIVILQTNNNNNNNNKELHELQETNRLPQHYWKCHQNLEKLASKWKKKLLISHTTVTLKEDQNHPTCMDSKCNLVATIVIPSLKEIGLWMLKCKSSLKVLCVCFVLFLFVCFLLLLFFWVFWGFFFFLTNSLKYCTLPWELIRWDEMYWNSYHQQVLTTCQIQIN